MARNDQALLPPAIVHVPKSHDLAHALRGSGGRYEKFLSEMAGAADPNSGRSGPVTLPGRLAGPVLEDLLDLLGRARERDHPAADAVEQLAGQLGYRSPEPARDGQGY